MKIQINITKEVLKKSARCGYATWNNCAIAVAIRDLFPSFSVYNSNIEKNYTHVCYLPKEASDFITIFDDAPYEERLLLPELSFIIDVSQKYIDEIGINEVHEILSKSKTLKLA